MNPVAERIRAWFPLVPIRPGWAGPKYTVMGRRQYRGRQRFVAGYSHSRLYSHHTSGLVYDRILGYGETQDAAIAMMVHKLLDHVEALTYPSPDTRFCPSCGADWRGPEIPAEVREHYGKATHYSRLVGIEVEGGYDGVSFWRCPDCTTEWARNTDRRRT